MILRHGHSTSCKRVQSCCALLANHRRQSAMHISTSDTDHSTAADLKALMQFYSPSKQLLKRIKQLSKGHTQKQKQGEIRINNEAERSLFLEGHRLVLDVLGGEELKALARSDLRCAPIKVFLSEKAVAAPLGKTLLRTLVALQQQQQLCVNNNNDNNNNDTSGSSSGISGLRPSLHVYWVSSETMVGLTATNTSQGVCAVVPYPRTHPSQGLLSTSSMSSALVICDGMADPGNLGSIIRTSYGLGATGVVAVQGCDPWSPKVLRSSMGFGIKFPVLQLQSWGDILGRGGLLTSATAATTANTTTDATTVSHSIIVHNIYMADNTKDAVPYFECDFLSPFALVIGSEAEGISEEVELLAASCSQHFHANYGIKKGKTETGSGGTSTIRFQKIKIPLRSSAESLNAAVACAIVLGEAARQRAMTIQQSGGSDKKSSSNVCTMTNDSFDQQNNS